ncbi:hypothetical protein L2E82_51088 [Cichorium intybus]|nr:hypothetical protein L2E82_51088 [Cichorium intybus]
MFSPTMFDNNEVLKEKKFQESSSKTRCYRLQIPFLPSTPFISFFDSISTTSIQLTIRFSSLSILSILNSLSVVHQ